MYGRKTVAVLNQELTFLSIHKRESHIAISSDHPAHRTWLPSFLKKSADLLSMVLYIPVSRQVTNMN